MSVDTAGPEALFIGSPTSAPTKAALYSSHPFPVIMSVVILILSALSFLSSAFSSGFSSTLSPYFDSDSRINLLSIYENYIYLRYISLHRSMLFRH